MADKPVLETGALRVRVQVPPPAPPGRAWSRYALRVFSVTKCTSRVLAGIFLSPVDSVTLDAIRIGFSVIFIFQSQFKVYLFHSPNTAER